MGNVCVCDCEIHHIIHLQKKTIIQNIKYKLIFSHSNTLTCYVQIILLLVYGGGAGEGGMRG